MYAAAVSPLCPTAWHEAERTYTVNMYDGRPVEGESPPPEAVRPLADMFPAYARALRSPYLRGVRTVSWLLPCTPAYDPRARALKAELVDLAVARLAHPHPAARKQAVDLVWLVGGPAEASSLIPLLNDAGGENYGICLEAARVLMYIGGRRELAAFDLWLQVQDALKERPAWVIGTVRGHRNQLAARLVEEARVELKARLADESRDKPAGR